MKEWVNTHPHDPMLLTMHDCTVTRIDLETSEDSTRMAWHLPDGIWVAPEIAGEGAVVHGEEHGVVGVCIDPFLHDTYRPSPSLRRTVRVFPFLK